MTIKNKNFCELLENMKQLKAQKWTRVAMGLREQFVALCNAFDVYPCGGAFSDDCTTQVFYID